MAKDARFWRNVTLIGLAHVAILVGLIRWSRETKSSNRQTIVWMNGGAGDGVAKTRSAAAPKPMKASTPPLEPRPSKTEEAEDEQPVLTSAKSDIQLPTPGSTRSRHRSRHRNQLPSPRPKEPFWPRHHRNHRRKRSRLRPNLTGTMNKQMRMRKRKRAQKLRWRRRTRATAIHRKNR